MIYLLLLSICAVGLILLVSLFIRVRAVTSAMQLKQHRSTEEGLADLLNYAAVIDDGVILGKNGSLMAAWIYRGKDLGSSTPAEREDVSKRINKAIAGLGNGWMLHIDAARRPAPGYTEAGANFFPNTVAKAIDEERRQLFQSIGTLYEGYFVIVATYFPPLLAEKKVAELMFDDDSIESSKRAQQDRTLAHFKQACETIESNLSIPLELIRLKSHRVVQEDGSEITQDDFLRWIQFCVTGRNHPINLPAAPMYIDSLVGGQELYGGVVPMIGGKYIQTVAIDGFAMESYPGILARLAELPIEYRWSNRFIFLDQHQAIAHLEKFRKKWRQKVRGFFDQVFNTHSGAIDQDALMMVDDAEDALAETKSGLVGQGYYTSVIVLMHEDRKHLEEMARQTEKEINTLGFSARIETINTMEAWLGSLPGHGVENVRRPLLNTLNLADMIPTSTIWTGQEYNPCPFYPPKSPPLMQVVTAGSSPFRLNLHVGDVGHTLIFGPTGAGKSTLLATLAAQAQRYRGMRVYSFDKGRSLEALTKACGGAHFSIGDRDISTLQFAPLQLIRDPQNHAWAADWIESIMILNDVQVTPQRRNEIEAAIRNNAAEQSYSLSDFSNTIQDAQVREALKSYTVDGSMGYLLDAENDNLELSSFSCFEIEELMSLNDKFRLPIMFYLFRRIELSLTGAPAFMFLDEAWIMLGHDLFKEKIREWLKVFRKKNCAVVLATQSLSDASKSGILDVLNESCLTKIYLPNPFARDEDATILYKRMGLNERQIEIIATAIPKRQYYYTSPQGRRLFELALGPLSLAFVGVSDGDTLALMYKFIDQFGDDWVNQWLISRGIDINQYATPY
ncbi:VirB4 family type IV secretion/conjugal transfer ATPase [Eikenella halliae]|uniref:Conjugal transfer protein TrbE n=1 Tax=Eikenella halliae TaxID=1795832 RepID=A0A1B6VZF1_9NEIS|nr:VirB4 family type IV secretion/conjugal transfer ATPase [Eikenella halliae]OAM43567.1 conjugal transfer protein TrbE [Eikenella halliae]